MIKNENIEDKVRITSVKGKMQKISLKLFGHMKGICKNVLIQRCQRLAINDFGEIKIEHKSIKMR